MLRQFICVDYPGYVKNDKEAIRTLGGIERIEQTFQRRNRKLFLNFTPDNLFSKMLCSNIIESTSLFNHPDPKENTHNNAEYTEGNNEFESKHEEKNVVLSRNCFELLTMPCLLMRVKKSKSTSTGVVKLEASVIGSVEKIYAFQKLADFQYLPMCTSISVPKNSNENNNQNSENNNNNTNSDSQVSFQHTAFYDNFKFNHIDNYEHDLRKNSIPQLFILPPFFSRFDDPVNYAFRSEPVKKELAKLKSTIAEAESGKSNLSCNESDEVESSECEEKKMNKSTELTGLIRSVRSERPSQAYLVPFTCKNIPEKASDKLKTPRNEMLLNCVDKLREIFAKRACYLKSVLLCVTNFSPSMLKEALPYVAYYFTTGPWRSCWVRFGYDPRLCADAKIYQMIDYRLRYSAEPEQKVKAKRRPSYHKRKWRNDLSESDSEEFKNFKFEKEMYKFNPNKLPTSRNVFYQLCDIEDDDVQSLILSNENKPNECSEKDGWCVSSIQNKCRNIMSQRHENLFKSLSIEQKNKK